MATYVTLWFDAEDYITPETDDVTLALGEILTELGVRATFKFVGERARVLEERGRQDVIEAMRPHDIGYHTDNHSRPPTVAEYCAELGLDEGAAEFLAREGQGARDVERIFGRQRCSCYGQAGGSWAPQVCLAMPELDIPLYLDEGGHVGLDDRPFWFMDVPHVFRMRSHCTRHRLDEPNNVTDALARFGGIATEAGADALISIYYHPCEFSTTAFWDGVNFRCGANPPPEQWQPAPVRSRDDQRRVLSDFRAYISGLCERGVTWLTAEELADMFGSPSPPPEAPARPEGNVVDLARQAAGRASFAYAAGRWWSAGEALFEIASALHEFHVTGKLPRALQGGVSALGPPERTAPLRRTDAVSLDAFMRALEALLETIDATGRLPANVAVAELDAPLAPVLQAAARMYLRAAAEMILPGEIALEPAELAAEEYVARDDERVWGWSIFPEGFSAPRLLELARLQAWTLKPAVIA